jgi:hypothetical protein
MSIIIIESKESEVFIMKTTKTNEKEKELTTQITNAKGETLTIVFPRVAPRYNKNYRYGLRNVH